jgi:hypothetical protein
MPTCCWSGPPRPSLLAISGFACPVRGIVEATTESMYPALLLWATLTLLFGKSGLARDTGGCCGAAVSWKSNAVCICCGGCCGEPCGGVGCLILLMVSAKKFFGEGGALGDGGVCDCVARNWAFLRLASSIIFCYPSACKCHNVGHTLIRKVTNLEIGFSVHRRIGRSRRQAARIGIHRAGAGRRRQIVSPR